MQGLIANGKITKDTKVWNGEGEWKSAHETELSEYFIKTSAVQPPPLPNTGVDDRYVWAAIASLTMGLLLPFELGLLFTALAAVLCVLDWRKLKARGPGYKKPGIGWIFVFIPVYLWQRTVVLEQKKYYFWSLIAIIVLAIIISFGSDRSCYEVVGLYNNPYCKN